MRLQSIAKDFVAISAIIIMAGFIIPPAGPSQIASDVLTMASLLFSILGGFAITILWERIRDVRNALSNETATTTTIWSLSDAFGKKVQRRIAKLIDDYLIVTLHYPLQFYEKSDAAFYRFFKAIERLAPKSRRQEAAYENMLEELEEMEESRMVTIYTAKLKLISYLSFSITVLGAIIIGVLFFTRTDTFYSHILSYVLSFVDVIVLLVIFDLNKLRLWENVLFEVNINRIYDIIGMPTFYEPELIRQGRHVPKPGEKYRTFDAKEKIIVRFWPKKK